jgi:hypothetical protein
LWTSVSTQECCKGKADQDRQSWQGHEEVIQPNLAGEPQIPIIPDPYTTSEVVMLDQKRTLPYYKKGKVVKKVSMITRSNVIGPKDYKQNQVDLAMRKALENYDNGGSGVFESEVDYAWPANLSTTRGA